MGHIGYQTKKIKLFLISFTLTISFYILVCIYFHLSTSRSDMLVPAPSQISVSLWVTSRMSPLAQHFSLSCKVWITFIAIPIILSLYLLIAFDMSVERWLKFHNVTSHTRCTASFYNSYDKFSSESVLSCIYMSLFSYFFTIPFSFIIFSRLRPVLL